MAGSGLTVLLARSGKSSRARQAGALDHAPSRSLFDAERAFGGEGGFGVALIATSFAHLNDGRIHVCGFASDEEGRRLHRSQAEGDLDAASATGIAAARRLLEEVRATQFLLRASSL
jgi:porphobilinogen deaminase